MREDAALSCGGSTWPVNCQSGITWAVRTKRIMSEVGSGGGAGSPAVKVSGGMMTLYSGVETGGGGEAESFAGGATGCDWLEWAGTLNSTGGGRAAGELSAAGLVEGA